jgi:hypothetical protein
MTKILRILSVIALLITSLVFLGSAWAAGFTFGGEALSASSQLASNIFGLLAAFSIIVIFVILKYRQSGKTIIATIVIYSLSLFLGTYWAVGLAYQYIYSFAGEYYSLSEFLNKGGVGYLAWFIIVISILSALFISSFTITQSSKTAK